MSRSPFGAVSELDARSAPCIDDAAAQRFRESGLLVLRGLLRGDELAALQAETQALVDRAASERVADYDFQYKRHETTQQDVPFRVEYVVDRTRAGKALLGHPFVLRSVEKLQGADFVPTWDSMVFKLPGAGAVIEWHRDADTRKCDPDRPIFNVDFYLDGSDGSNCLWGIPGSNRWTDEEASRACEELAAAGFGPEVAVPILLEPGDVLLACLADRAAAPWSRGETPYLYRPSPEHAPPPLARGGRLETYRVPHHEHWRLE